MDGSAITQRIWIAIYSSVKPSPTAPLSITPRVRGAWVDAESSATSAPLVCWLEQPLRITLPLLPAPSFGRRFNGERVLGHFPEFISPY
jgi:hypothetical protein